MPSVITAAHRGLAKSDPLANGLVIAAVASGSQFVSIVGPTFVPGSFTGMTSVLGPNGVGAGSNAAAVNTLQGYKMVAPNALPTSAATITLGYYKTDTTKRASAAFGYEPIISANTSRIGAHLPYSDGTVYFDFGGATGSNRLTKSGLTSYNGIWSFTAGPAGMSMWLNGVKLAESTTAVTRDNSFFAGFWLLNGNVGAAMPSSLTGCDNAVIPFFYIHDRQLLPAEIERLHGSPTAPLDTYPSRRTVVILNGGVGGTPAQDIGASTGTITLSGVAGAITPAGGPTIGAATGTITLTGVNGAITSGATTIGSATGVVTLSGVAGAISPAGGPTIGAATGTITLTGVAGAISFPATSDPNGINFTFRETGHTTTFRERA